MQNITGKIAFGGIAIGKIKEISKENNVVRRVKIEDAKAEIARFEAARDQAAEELKGLYDKAVKEVGEANAAIFEVHQMMLEDEDYLDSVRNIIEAQSVNAEFAVATTGDNFAKMFADMDDDYMKERAADVKDISERVIRVLSQKEEKVNTSGAEKEKYIIAADDLAPSETIQLDRETVLAFVTRHGSTNSHTAILARTMNIPALVSTAVPKEVNGKMAIVDGFKGIVIIDPDEETLREYEKKQQDEKNRQELLQQLKGKPTVTKEGKEIKLYANIGEVKDLGAVLQNDAAGIGLFRSEFLYLQSDHFPTEDEQFQSYKTVAEVMAGKKSHYPYSGYWSRQADRLLWTRTRGQSGAWLPCREDLSGSAGYFQDTVESTAPRQHVRQYFHYDPDDRIGMGSEKSQRDYGRGKSRADLRRHSV